MKNTDADPKGFLMRFLDGPLAGRGNIRNAGGGVDLLVPSGAWEWPLPARLGVLALPEETENVALWDADSDVSMGLPEEIRRSPNAVVYRKVSESQMPRGSAGFARGVMYRLERDDA